MQQLVKLLHRYVFKAEHALHVKYVYNAIQLPL